VLRGPLVIRVEHAVAIEKYVQRLGYADASLGGGAAQPYRDLLDQVTRLIEMFGCGWRGADRRVPTLIVVASCAMLYRDAATLGAPIFSFCS
jgi:hypothetical protein